MSAPFRGILCGNIRYTFGDNGMLQGIFMPEEFGSVNLMKESSSLSLAYTDGRNFVPVAGDVEPVLWKSRNHDLEKRKRSSRAAHPKTQRTDYPYQRQP